MTAAVAPTSHPPLPSLTLSLLLRQLPFPGPATAACILVQSSSHSLTLRWPAFWRHASSCPQYPSSHSPVPTSCRVLLPSWLRSRCILERRSCAPAKTTTGRAHFDFPATPRRSATMAAALRNGRAPERLQAVKVPRYSFTRLRVDGHQDRPGRRGTSIMDVLPYWLYC